ncbi:spermine oxidase-like isoform X2 [Pecten maximus]|nr:spermine oxidase-like isoform X2 [Pecten maximus]XP_033742491.1 spermine oxidase-like isoform X2 [Pecten maximus]
MASQSADVIIIGAGIAGVTAANKLFASGYKDVKILEARNRIGGRIHTVSLGPNACSVEMGAQWIHGGGDNPVYCIALAHDLLDHSNVHDEFAGAYYNENGTSVDKSLLDTVTTIFKETVEDMVDFSFSDSKSTLTCQEYLTNRMSTILSPISDAQKEEAANIFRSLLNILKEDCGDDLTNLSLRCNGFEDDFRNDDHTLPAGYENLLRIQMSNFEPDVIRFETEVKLIDWSEKENGMDSVVLKCVERGTEMTYTANHVISTIPLGVLKKKHKQLFSPALPAGKASLIEKLGFGKVNKILLHYEEPFWTKGNGGIKLVWDQAPKCDVGERSWARDIFAFKEMKHIDNMLIAWIYGDSAEQIENIDEARVGEVCTQVLRQFLSDNTIPNPSSVRTSKWCTDPHTLGAYTFVPSDCHYDDVGRSAKPLLRSSGKPTVLFAGEATHSDNYGSVHGAMISGIREATRITKWKTKQGY